MPKVFLIKRNLNKAIEDSTVSGFEHFKTKISVPQERDTKFTVTSQRTEDINLRCFRKTSVGKATTFSFKELPKNEQLRRLYDSKDDWYFINSIFIYRKKMNPDSDKNDLAKFLFHNTSFFNYLGSNSNSVKKNLWSNQRQFYISTKNERQTKENSPKTVKTLSEKPHKCHICFKEFARGSSLSNHLVIHKNDKVFQCRRCNSKFLRKSDLEKQKMIHSERKPFKCSICNKQFNQSSNMLTHQRRHSGIRPFSCELCGKRFYRKVDVRRHHLVNTVDQH